MRCHGAHTPHSICLKQYSPVACDPVRDLILNAPSDKLNRVIKRFLPGGVIENPARVCEDAISRCTKCENVLVDTWVRVEVGMSVWLFAIRTETGRMGKLRLDGRGQNAQASNSGVTAMVAAMGPRAYISAIMFFSPATWPCSVMRIFGGFVTAKHPLFGSQLRHT